MITRRKCGRTCSPKSRICSCRFAAPQLEHDVRAPGVAVLLDRRDAVGRRAGDRACTCRAARPSPAPSPRAGRPAPSPRRPGGSRPARSRRGRAACRPSPGCSAPCWRGTCRRSRARRRGPRRGRSRGSRRRPCSRCRCPACTLLARVADERGRRDRRRQAAVADLAGERLHLRRRRRDVDRRHAARRVRLRPAAPARRRSTSPPSYSNALAAEHAAHDRDRVAHRPERLRSSASAALLRKIFDVPKPRMNRPGRRPPARRARPSRPAPGCRVNGEMIPSRSSAASSRAPSARRRPVDERASIPCLRHHGYASASQIVSMPASSIARADASISSSGSMVSCITPTRNGTAIAARQASGAAATARPAPAGRAPPSTCWHLLVDDRLQHALPHRADGARRS